MANSLLIKSSEICIMPKIFATNNIGRHSLDLQARSCRLFSDRQTNSNLSVMLTVGETRNSRTRLHSVFSAYHTFIVSYPMTTTLSLPENHQVFINYRGEEVGHNIVSHITDAFERHRIKFFVDKDEQRGKDLKNIFVRIEESRIALAIFSTRYPESKGCMNELVKMKRLDDDGKLHIIPIFYKVEPSDVRKPTSESEFGKNFWRLMETSDKKDPIQEWREALECISNKMGLFLGDKRYITFGSSEADFVKKTVKEVGRVNEEIGLEK